jgi:hypothetical protein
MHEHLFDVFIGDGFFVGEFDEIAKFRIIRILIKDWRLQYRVPQSTLLNPVVDFHLFWIIEVIFRNLSYLWGPVIINLILI